MVPLDAKPAAPSFPQQVRCELSFKSLALVIGLVAGLWALFNLIPVLLVLVAALMAVGALEPIVAWWERHQVRRVFAICLVFGVSVLIVVGLATTTIPTVLEQLKTLAENEPRLRETVASYLDRSHLTSALADDLRNVHYTELLKSSHMTLLSWSTRMVEFLAYAIATVFLAFYIMIDRDRWRGALFAVVPRRHHIRLSSVLINLSSIVGGYIRGQVLTCIFTTLFILVLLLVCDVPNALALAVFGGLMDLLPYIGVFLTMGPAVLAASAQGPMIALVVFASLLAYEELESRVLVPLVYGRSLRLPSSVIFFSLLVGTTLGGITGALLALPLALPLAATVLMLLNELRVKLPGETIQPEFIQQKQRDDDIEKEYERRAESMPVSQAAAVAVAISEQEKKTLQAKQKDEPVAASDQA